MVLSWACNAAGAWPVAASELFAAVEYGSRVSRKQAFATDEASANNHTSNITNAVLRLVRVSAKNVMVGTSYL